MPGGQSNLKIRLDAEFPGESAFKSAEASAKILARELGKVEDATRAMAAAEAAAYREGEKMVADHEAAVRKMAAAEAAAYRELEAAQQRQHAAMTKVGTAFAAVGAGAVTGLGLATKAAVDWESAWAGVTKTVDGSPAQMAALESSLRDLAKTLPATHEEIAGVAEAAGQLGVARADVTGFTKTMIDLGQTTNLSADDAATGLAKLMNVMQTAPEDVGRLGSTLVALGNAGASTEADVLAMAQRISGAGKLVGASEADVLALANALSSVGVEAELGGGVTTRVMQKIYSAVKDGGDALDGFASVSGMSSQAFAAQWESSPVRALDAFFQGLNQVEASGGNVVKTLGDLGLRGTEETSVLLRMKGAGDLLAQSLDLGSRAWEENAALTEEANKRYETTESRLAMARNQINDAAIDIGGNLLPVLAEGADFVSNLATAFGSLSEGQQDFVVALGAGAAGLIGLVGGAAVVIPKLVELKGVLDDLGGGSSRLGKGLGAAVGILTGPWGLAIAAATIGIGVWAAKQGEAKRQVDTLAGALDAQTGAITANARALVIQQLADDGILEKAREQGLALDVVTDAALGNAAALDKVRSAKDAVWAKAAVDPTGGGEYAQQAMEIDNLVGALQKQAGVTDDAVAAAKLKAEAMGEDASATGQAGDASAIAAGQVDELGRATDTTTDEVHELQKTLAAIIGMFFDVENATIAAESAIDDLSEAAAKNGATLDLGTQQGRDNAKALQERVTTSADLIAAMAREGHSQEELVSKTADLKDAFAAQMRQLGFSEEAIARYAGAFDEIPAQVMTAVKAEGVDVASDGVQKLLDRLAAMPREKITSVRINEIVNRGGNTGGGYATGGEVRGPGTETSDSIPARLSSGEHVITAREVRAFGGHEAVRGLRAGALANPARLAVGGTVTSPGLGAGAVVTRSLLTAALSTTSGPVDASRYLAALLGQGQAADVAAAAESRLSEVREQSARTLADLSERLSTAKQAQKDANTAAEDAAQDQITRMRQSKASDAAITAAQNRLTALKRANTAAEKELARASEKEAAAAKAQAKIDEATASDLATAAKTREKDATDALSDAEDELAEARRRAVTLADQVAQSVTRSATLSAGNGKTPRTGAELLAAKQAQLADAQAYTAGIGQLMGSGLSADLLDEILGAGPGGGGLDLTRAILGGDADLIASLNDVQSQLTATATGLGTAVSYARYGVNGAGATTTLDASSVALLQQAVMAVANRPTTLLLPNGQVLAQTVNQENAMTAYRTSR